uniref:uncharacterized protein LOC122607073 n=1 Tax=Erigeron canadensis TaxID=72917 RepID=UPI001CB93E34|nr:uncharacterized protein LOC122607073 [Erigeron canadensis]
MQKFLRSDIAELLRNDLYFEAYKRAGRLYLDQVKTLSYDVVEQFCTLISSHLVALDCQSECPDECKEAVSSLVYAAARFGDLPELHALRSLFSEKYGDTLKSYDFFVNKEFVNLLEPDRPTKEMKVHLMQEIASEHGIEWDSKSLEHQLDKPPISLHDWSQNAYSDQDNEYRITDHENSWLVNIQESRNEDTNDPAIAKTNNRASSEIEKQTETMRQRILDFLSRATSFHSTSRETTTSPEESSSSSSTDDSTKSKPFFGFRLMPPPYIRNDPNKKERNSNPSPNSTKAKQRHHRNKENLQASNDPNIEILDNEKAPAPHGLMNLRRRKGARSHSIDILPNSTMPKGHTRTGSYQPDLTRSHPIRPVHPKLPDYDDIIARFAALRAKS